MILLETLLPRRAVRDSGAETEEHTRAAITVIRSGNQKRLVLDLKLATPLLGAAEGRHASGNNEKIGYRLLVAL